jgi:hypothetical protein
MIRPFPRILIILILCVWAGMTYSQPLPENENQVVFKRHSLGFHLNPHKERLAGMPTFDRYLIKSTLRYGYRANFNTTLGAELSATHRQMGGDRFYSTVGLGTFGRYWLWQKPWIRTGVEGNVFVTRRFYDLAGNGQNDMYYDYYKQESSRTSKR